MNPRRLLPVAVAAGSFLLLYRVLDLSVAWPELDLATPGGRARLLALAVSRLPGPLLADFLLIGVAVSTRHPGGLRLLGWTHLVGGFLLLALAPAFLIDSGTLAPSVLGGEIFIFRLLVVRVLVLLLGLGLGAVLAGRFVLTLIPKEGRAPAVDLDRKS